MPDIKQIFHEEIRRLARKEIKQDFNAMQKQMMEQKKTISALIKQMAALEKALKKVSNEKIRSEEKNAPEKEIATEAVKGKPRGRYDGKKGRKSKFRPSFMKKFRQKTGLSQSNIATLLGCTTFTISHWETGKNVPNKTKLAELSKYFNAGKKEIYAALLEKGIDLKAELSAEKSKKKLSNKTNMSGRKRLKKVIEPKTENTVAAAVEETPAPPVQ